MNIIKIKVDFENRELEKDGVSLVEGDYNSTKIVFEFDKEYSERKVFEMAKPGTEEAFFVTEIINNEVVLTAEEDGHNVSIFDQVGKYPFEVTLYGTDSKLTSLNGSLPVKKEMVRIGDIEVERYLPVFDQLMQEINTATEAASDAVEAANNQDIDLIDSTTEAEIIITRKTGEQKTATIPKSGGGGTGNYEDLENKPQIGGHTLLGNKTLQELGIQAKGNYIEQETDPTVPSHVKGIQQTDINNWNNKATTQDITTAVGTETTNRQTADNNLQSQIDALANANDVVDVLATYQDLLSYDTQHLKNNDIIKVMTDSTHSNAISYFKWVITDNVGAWSYVGSQGPFYTKSETDTLLNAKANISDIPTELADLTEDSTHRIVTDTEKTTWNNKENTSNKVTTISSSSTDTQYPSAKCVYDLIGDINTALTNLNTGSGV